MQKLEIYTDGSCKRNPGPGGWAYLIIGDNTELKGSGGESGSTNNRMEMKAATEALRAVENMGDKNGEIILHSDSRLVIKTMTEGWKRKENLDLWSELDTIVRSLLQKGWELQWRWVKGHAGHKYNELVDDWAQEAADKIAANNDNFNKAVDTAPVQMLLVTDDDDTQLRNLLAEQTFDCINCASKTAGKLSRKKADGPIRVDCDKCGKYIKFGKQN